MLLNNPSDHYICKLFWGFGKTVSMSLRTALQNVCSAKFTSYKKILKGPTESPTFLFASHPMGLFSTKIPRGRIYSSASSKWMWIWIIMIDLHAFTFSWRTLWEGEWVPCMTHKNFNMFRKNWKYPLVFRNLRSLGWRTSAESASLSSPVLWNGHIIPS